MTITQAPAPAWSARQHSRPDLGRQLIGGFFLVTGGVHLGLVAADPPVCRSLLVFGWWIWAWCVPALALLGWFAHRDLALGKDPA